MGVAIDKNKCTGCGACADICPVHAITVAAEKASIAEACIECGACIGQCPQDAISL